MLSTSGILIIGHPNPESLEYGAATVSGFAAAKKVLSERQPSLLVFGGIDQRHFDSFCEWAQKNSPHSLWILTTEGLSPKQIIHWNNFGRVHDFVETLTDPQLETKIQSALEKIGESSQQKNLVEMFAEQSLHFKHLSTELESRVDKRQKVLQKSLQTLDQTKQRLETLHRAMLGIHRAISIPQIEESLSEALRDSLAIDWVRLRFEHQSLINEKKLPHILEVRVICPNENLRAKVYFSKRDSAAFSAKEIDFLHELADALGLALSHLHALEQAEMVKAQWQATFDSIPHPLCLTTNEFDILKLNRAFQTACSSQSFRSLLGKNCFSKFFGDGLADLTALKEPLNTRLTRMTRGDVEHYEVVGQSLGLRYDEQPVRMVLMRSVTEDVRMERRILESSKMAELGTIGSSIAHELNNPLGGMLSFLQLILLDLKPEDAQYAEIKAMEAATLRCRDIVINLLSFARKQDLGEFGRVDLQSLTNKAIKLVELQSKSKGIEIKIETLGNPTTLGSGNALTHALCNLLQNSIDAIADKLPDEKFLGLIRVQIWQLPQHVQIQVHDNGSGIRPDLQSQIFNPHFTTRNNSTNRGMGLTVAYTIVNEHKGSLEIVSQHGVGSSAIVTLPLDVPLERQDFDGEI